MSCCTGKNGKPKKSYSSEVEANRQKQILEKQGNVNLIVYKCNREKHRWHLASSIESSSALENSSVSTSKGIKITIAKMLKPEMLNQLRKQIK